MCPTFPEGLLHVITTLVRCNKIPLDVGTALLTLFGGNPKGFVISDLVIKRGEYIIKKSNLVDRVTGIAKDAISDAKDALVKKFQEIRGELLNKILYDIREKINIPDKIYPDNVYDDEGM